MLTILSWNVNGGGNAAASVVRLNTLLEQDLARHGKSVLDIIALQDVSLTTMAKLARQLSPDYTIVDSWGLLDARVGLLVALHKATLALNDNPVVIGTRAMELSLCGNSGSLCLVNVYLPHATKSARKDQIGTKLGTIEGLRMRAKGLLGLPMIACGDFNTALTMCTSAPVRFRSRGGSTLVPDFATLGPRSETPAPFNELAQERTALLGLIADGFSDPRTFAGKEPIHHYSNWGLPSNSVSIGQQGDVPGVVFLRPLDYIIASEPLGLLEHRYIYAAHGWQASDHLPVMAVLAAKAIPHR